MPARHRSTGLLRPRWRLASALVLVSMLTLGSADPAALVPSVEAAGAVTDCTSYSAPGGLQGALAGGGTVTFACDGTIVVPELVIPAGMSVTLDGSGRSVRLSGNRANRVFRVHSGASLTLKHLEVVHGNGLPEGHSGAILSGGALTLVHTTVTENTAGLVGGGISNQGGTLTLTSSTVSHNHLTGAKHGVFGGGIYSPSGSVTLTDSTIYGNSGWRAGGIYNGGTLTATNSTISSNYASAVFLLGGGLYNEGTATLVHSTVVGNVAAQRGGGILNGSFARLTLRGTIVAGNQSDAVTTADCDQQGPITTSGGNLVGVGTGCPVAGPGDMTVAPADVFTTLLRPLGSYGGPTLTHALRPGSAATDAIPTAGCTAASGATLATDQRGVVRPQGSACDIGAFELGVQPAPTAVTVTFNDAAGSRRQFEGEFPAGAINWGTQAWWLAAPTGRFTTKSVSFNGNKRPPLTEASFALVTPRRLLRLDAFNAGSTPALVTLRCDGASAKSVEVRSGELVTIETGWTMPCANVLVAADNGWDTNFDNITFEDAGLLATQQVVTLNTLAGANRALTGEAPAGLIAWRAGEWFLAGPYGAFNSKSVSLAPGRTQGTLAFLVPQRLISLQAHNGGSAATTLTLQCADQPSKIVSLAAGQTLTITTDWTQTCRQVTLFNTQGWDTNIDNLYLDSAPAV